MIKLTAVQAQKLLKKYAISSQAQIAQRFFKTGEGEYGAFDQFIGISVPKVRLVAKNFKTLERSQLRILLKSKIHEERLLALIILVEQIKKATLNDQKKITAFYLKNLKHVNNWDLVDVSAEWLLGKQLFEHHTLQQSLKILSQMAHSNDLWRRRVSIIATFYFIRRLEFKPTLHISKILLNDQHDLIHKAVGWMIREVGKRSLPTEEKFLKATYKKMPRTMIRYAIEKFPEKKRLSYLRSKK